MLYRNQQKQNDASPLQYASEELKNNEEVVLTVIQKKGFAIRYASLILKQKKEPAITAKKNGLALKYLDLGLFKFKGHRL